MLLRCNAPRGHAQRKLVLGRVRMPPVESQMACIGKQACKHVHSRNR